MMDRMLLSASEVSIAVLNYNGLDVLAGCLDSTGELSEPAGEVLLVDDGSTDGSPEWVSRQYPEIRLVRLGENTGRLNMVRNLALREAANDLVLLVDNDVVLHPEVLDVLLDALTTLPAAAVCTPRTLYAHDPATIYQDGQTLHYVAATQARNRDLPRDEADHIPQLTIGWGVQLIDRAKAASVGWFNEEYVMGWGDDGEFNHRMNLSGRFCYHVPQAIVYHKRVSGAQRYEGTVRNRWRFIIECYELRTLVLCAPALLLYEIALVGFLAMKGALPEYLRAGRYIVGHLPSVLATRRRVQRTRRVPDRELMASGNLFIAEEYLDRRILAFGLSALDRLLNAYWSLVRRWL